MSTTESSTSSPALLAPTPSTSTNIVGTFLASDHETESDSLPPVVPWRTGADTPLPYLGHTHWREHHLPEVERPRLRLRRRIVVRRKRRVVNEIGITRDFFLIISLCFVLACLLIVLLRPIALEILWYIDDSY